MGRVIASSFGTAREDDSRPSVDEGPRCLQPDPGVRAGDDRDLTLQIKSKPPVLVVGRLLSINS